MMLLGILAVLLGLLLLVWSAGLFVDGASSTARHFGISPFLIGMVIVGFGTSVPEMLVSALASWQGNPGIAIGNAYGSNIANIALILGFAAVINPISVNSSVLRKELPILTAITALSILLLLDLKISLSDALLLLVVFAGLMGWTIYHGLRDKSDSFAKEMELQPYPKDIPIQKAISTLLVGLLILIASSRLLVWGAVKIAAIFGVSDMIIGLTIVAVGTSLPELASSIIAAKKGEHDIALGNVLGSNLFNTLVVVGLAGVIRPFSVERGALIRDLPVMAVLTVSLFIIGYGFRGRQGRINRIEGTVLLLGYLAYTAWLIVN